jgi:dihydrofolate synthase / folylpolyglutamate synthase
MDPIAYLFGLETSGMHFGLERIRALAAALGHPERAFRRVVVAGTNGKGSVTVLTETALRIAGHRVARYTSPHLVHLEERFVVDGVVATTDDLRSAADTVRRAIEALMGRGILTAPPTFFEATTAVGFELFRRAGVEVAVLEVGLGGRLDATNVDAPFAAAITNVDLDHQAYLGASVPAIAREKAGVIHPGTVAVLGDTNPEVVAVVAEVCRAGGARLVRTSEAAQSVSELGPDGRIRFELATTRRRYRPVTLGLRGRHQLENALTAAVLLEEIDALGLAVPPDAVEAGLAQARWPGRLEPFAIGNRQILLDAAHNPAGARALAAYLREIHPAGVPIVIAVMRDKDAAGMLTALAPAATRVTATEAPNPRTTPAAALGTVARAAAPGVPVEVEPDPARALDAALAQAPVVCVAGSIFLVGAVRTLLESRGGVPLP